MTAQCRRAGGTLGEETHSTCTVCPAVAGWDRTEMVTVVGAAVRWSVVRYYGKMECGKMEYGKMDCGKME